MKNRQTLSMDDCLELAELVIGGDETASTKLFDGFRAYVTRFIDLRLDSALRTRVDAADIYQDTIVEANRRLAEFVERKPMPFNIWLVKIAVKQLGHSRVKHLVREKRNASLEVPLPDRSSIMLAKRMFSQSTPSRVAMKRERSELLSAVISRLARTDQEILLLRHVEGFEHAEIAALLDINREAARQRYIRAIMRLRKLCSNERIDFGVEE